MSIPPILPWNKPAKIAMGTGSVLATAALISGVVLMILKGNSPLSLGLTCGGAATLTLAGLYSSIAACSKRGPSQSQPPAAPVVPKKSVIKVPSVEGSEESDGSSSDPVNQRLVLSPVIQQRFPLTKNKKTIFTLPKCLFPIKINSKEADQLG